MRVKLPFDENLIIRCHTFNKNSFTSCFCETENMRQKNYEDKFSTLNKSRSQKHRRIHFLTQPETKKEKYSDATG